MIMPRTSNGWPTIAATRDWRSGRDGRFAQVAPLLAMVDDWQALLNSGTPEQQLRELRDHARTGRPLGGGSFVQRLETLLDRRLRPRRPGRRPRFSKLPK